MEMDKVWCGASKRPAHHGADRGENSENLSAAGDRNPGRPFADGAERVAAREDSGPEFGRQVAAQAQNVIFNPPTLREKIVINMENAHTG